MSVLEDAQRYLDNVAADWIDPEVNMLDMIRELVDEATTTLETLSEAEDKIETLDTEIANLNDEHQKELDKQSVELTKLASDAADERDAARQALAVARAEIDHLQGENVRLTSERNAARDASSKETRRRRTP